MYGLQDEIDRLRNQLEQKDNEIYQELIKIRLLIEELVKMKAKQLGLDKSTEEILEEEIKKPEMLKVIRELAKK